MRGNPAQTAIVEPALKGDLPSAKPKTAQGTGPEPGGAANLPGGARGAPDAASAPAVVAPGVFPSEPLSDSAKFAEAYGEPLDRVLDLGTWKRPDDLGEAYDRIEKEFGEAVALEEQLSPTLRRDVFPRIRSRPGAPEEAGVFQATPAQIRQVHRSVLLNGAIEACDGTHAEHDTLPVTLTQLGVALLSYRGDQQTYCQRLFRRDLRIKSENSFSDLMALMEGRMERSGLEMEDREQLSRLTRRGLMTYAERAVLTYESQACWRMGHGSPISLELIADEHSLPLQKYSLPMLRDLLLEHRKFVFVPSAPAQRQWLTQGLALRPLEYLVLDTAEPMLRRMVESGTYHLRTGIQVGKFCEDAGPQLMVGVFRASNMAPPYLFYAHRDHVHEAALIALADSVMQEHRGFPLLIDLADSICRFAFGTEALTAAVQNAYATSGASFRYLAERQTRQKQ